MNARALRARGLALPRRYLTGLVCSRQGLGPYGIIDAREKPFHGFTQEVSYTLGKYWVCDAFEHSFNFTFWGKVSEKWAQVSPLSSKH